MDYNAFCHQNQDKIKFFQKNVTKMLTNKKMCAILNLSPNEQQKEREAKMIKKADKISELVDLIYGVYKNESACAAAMGWQRQRLNKITTGNKEPDVSELNELAVALHKSVGEIAEIFLRAKSPNEQQKAF